MNEREETKPGVAAHKEPEQLVFDFLGKDSIRYYNVVDVEPRIWKNIRLFKDGKTEGDDIFDRVTVRAFSPSAHPAPSSRECVL